MLKCCKSQFEMYYYILKNRMCRYNDNVVFIFVRIFSRGILKQKLMFEGWLPALMENKQISLPFTKMSNIHKFPVRVGLVTMYHPSSNIWYSFSTPRPNNSQLPRMQWKAAQKAGRLREFMQVNELSRWFGETPWKKFNEPTGHILFCSYETQHRRTR